VLPKYRAVIFVNGCFWHGHDCHLFKWPSTRRAFWKAKIERNQLVDQRVSAALRESSWRQAIVWECALKGRTRLPVETILTECATWIGSTTSQLEVRGSGDGDS
jgi:DNA mismatch endonuclease (patch repair protein)